MVDKVIVSPEEVRGLGNVVIPKSIADFETYNCSLTLDDNVYTMRVGGYSVTLRLSSNTVYYGTTVTLVATVIDLTDSSPVVGETVEFFAGDTSLGTSPTNAQGNATITESTLLPGIYTLFAKYASSTGSASLIVNKITPTMQLSQGTVYVDDSYVVLTAYVRDNGNPVPGVTLDVYNHDSLIGDNLIGSVVTGNDGNASTGNLIPCTGSSEGKEYFVRLRETPIYNAQSSNTVTVHLSKHHSNIWHDLPETTWYVDEPVFFAVGLKDDNDDFLTGTVKVYVDGSLHQSVYCEDDIEMVDDFYISEGTTLVRLVYDGSNVYESAELSINMTGILKYDDISLSKTAGSQILSYADEQSTPNSQYCTVTAQLLDGGSPAEWSGFPITFGVYKNDVLIGTESVVNTDSSGQASYTYHSVGRGDVEVRAIPEDRILVSKTYSLEDCWGCDVPSSDKSRRYSSTMFIRENANGQNVSYNSNGYYTHSISVNGHKGVFLPFIEDATDDFCIECDVKKTSGVCGLGVYYDSNNTYQLETNSNILRVGKKVNGTFSETNSTSSVIKNNEWQHYKFEVIGNNIKLTVTDENSDTVSVNQDIPTRNSNVKCFLSIAYVHPQQNLFKNLKIKPL